jgi:hypothetical protein
MKHTLRSVLKGGGNETASRTISVLEAKLPDLTATGEFRLQPDGHPEGYVLVEQELQEAMRILCTLSAAWERAA